MGKSERLTGRVAGVVNELIALNVGRQDGVTEDDIFLLRPRDIEVRDPDTNELLGVVPYSEKRLRIVDIQEHFSVTQFTNPLMARGEGAAYGDSVIRW